MAWTTPRTWVAGETVTSALLNVQLRDNLNLLKTNIDDDGKLACQPLYSSITPVGNVGAGLDDLMTYTVPANTLSADTMALHVSGYLVTAGAGNKVIEFHFGASSFQLFNGVAATRHQIAGYIYRTGVASQFMFMQDVSASGVQQVQEASPVEDETAAIDMKFKGSDALAVNDNVQQKAMLVKLLRV